MKAAHNEALTISFLTLFSFHFFNSSLFFSFISSLCHILFADALRANSNFLIQKLFNRFGNNNWMKNETLSASNLLKWGWNYSITWKCSNFFFAFLFQFYVALFRFVRQTNCYCIGNHLNGMWNWKSFHSNQHSNTHRTPNIKSFERYAYFHEVTDSIFIFRNLRTCNERLGKRKPEKNGRMMEWHFTANRVIWLLLWSLEKET